MKHRKIIGLKQFTQMAYITKFINLNQPRQPRKLSNIMHTLDSIDQLRN